MSRGQISVERLLAPWRDQKRKYKVFVDQQPAGLIAAGESRVISVPPGNHLLQLKIDWLGSPAVTVHVSEGRTVRFEAEPGGSSWRAILDALLRRRPYITLRQLP